MVDDRRIQVDCRNLPEGAKPKLRLMAVEAGVSFTDYIRTILVEHAINGSAPGAPRITKKAIEESAYEPVR